MVSRSSPRRGVRRWTDRPDAPLQLVCFAHAGGGAGAYRSWGQQLPPGFEVLAAQYPGREDRVGDDLVDEMDKLVDMLARDLIGLVDRPWLVFGHSMGSAVAFETVRRLRQLGCPEPDRLVVSGRRAPDRFRGGDVHRRGPEALRQELERLGGTPAEVFEHPELAAMVLRVLDNDYRLIETYHPRAEEPLSCPVTVVVATDDPELSSPDAAAWHALGAGGDVVELPGDHFYLIPHRDRLLAQIVARVDPALTGAGVFGP